jgi:hypothetical protein
MRRFTNAARSGVDKAQSLHAGGSLLRDGIQQGGGRLATLFLFCCGLMCISSFLISLRADTKARSGAYQAHHGKDSTLIVYIMSRGEPTSGANLEFFVRHGVRRHASRRVDYIVLVNLFGGVDRAKLPALPADIARYVFHGSSCNHHGSIGWLLQQSGEVELDAYQYYAFFDSTMRGPFVPAHYMPHDWHWVQAFTDKLNEQVKMVGPVVSCTAVAHRGQAEGPWRRVPHVETSAFATDRLGLQVGPQGGGGDWAGRPAAWPPGLAALPAASRWAVQRQARDAAGGCRRAAPPALKLQECRAMRRTRCTTPAGSRPFLPQPGPARPHAPPPLLNPPLLRRCC